MRRPLCLVTAGLLATLAGCPGPASDQVRPTAVTPVRDCCVAGRAVARHWAIAKTAAELIGARTIRFKGRRISYDCAGVTRAIYLSHGIDLYDSPDADGDANGVRLIYDHVQRHGRIHRGPAVHPGDLVFFDNTWDHDGDGRVNDPLTHVGVVERVEPDGTVVFISRVSRAIERYRMNLAQPHVHRDKDGRVLNDFMRRKRGSDSRDTRYLTGELFAAFGTRITP